MRQGLKFKGAILGVAVAFSAAASADDTGLTQSIRCGFTEPFFSLNVDLPTGLVTKTEPDWDDKDKDNDEITTVVAENAKLKVTSSDPLYPTFEIVLENGESILSLELNGKGSDGMSEIRFPFSGEFQDMIGGCETDRLPAYNPEAGD